MDKVAGRDDERNTAEHSVLGAILLRREIPPAVDLVPDEFHDPRLAALYRAALAVADEAAPIDPVLIADRAGIPGGLALLADCQRATPTAENVAHYMRIVRERATEDRVRVALADVLHAPRGEVVERVARLAEDLDARPALRLADRDPRMAAAGDADRRSRLRREVARPRDGFGLGGPGGCREYLHGARPRHARLEPVPAQT